MQTTEVDSGRLVKRAAKRFYVDVHPTAVKNSGKRKLHVVFDGNCVFEVGRLSEIAAERGDEVYVDVILPPVYDDVVKLLNRGVKVFRLRRTDAISNYRNMLSFDKTDENDAKLLALVGKHNFNEITAEHVEMIKLLDEYHRHLQALKKLKQLQNGSGHLHEAMLAVRRGKRSLADKIIKNAGEVIPEYGRLCETLRISSFGKVALADLLIHVDFSVKLRKILCYTGFYKPNKGLYNHRMKQAATSLAISHYRRCRVKAREVRLLLKTIKKALAGSPA